MRLSLIMLTRLLGTRCSYSYLSVEETEAPGGEGAASLRRHSSSEEEPGLAAGSACLSVLTLCSLDRCCPVALHPHVVRAPFGAGGRNQSWVVNSWSSALGATPGSGGLRSTSCSDLAVC